jgi:hypothetical protein
MNGTWIEEPTLRFCGIREWSFPMKILTIRALIAPALLLAGLLLSGAAQAQSCMEAQREITATDRALEVVGTAARESGDSGARDQLDNAVRIQAQAKALFFEGRCPRAAQLSRKAHEIANRVLVKVRPGAGDRQARPGFVGKELERTDELLARVSPRVKESGNDRAQILLDRAMQLQAQAWGVFRAATSSARPDDSRLVSALELTSRAREAGRQALNLCSSDQGLNPDRLAEELRQTDEQIATAVEWSRSAAEAAPSSLEQLGVARALEERARRHFDQREYPESMRLTLRARDLVRGVLSGPAQVDPAELDRAMQAAQAAIEKARGAGLPQPGLRLLAQAELRYSRAQEQRDAGHPWVALLGARAARNLAQRAMGPP